jgi:site-specific DNA-methyltransferase (adenine-specific)
MDDAYCLLHGDCRERLQSLHDNSIDAIVTDPPYGLSFMGKKWDYDVPSADIWRECMRVLKPGGHLLAFAGTRTQHRMACNIEDAGFDIRDMIAWVYGSGFPKSLDVSKAIDKAAGAKREVVGSKVTGNAKQATSRTGEFADGLHGGQQQVDITAPATDAARQWDGWGTALKPAMEPITVARKPICGTAAENVLRHGTGGINVDGCRVGDGQTITIRGKTQTSPSGWVSDGAEDVVYKTNPPGRWPANLIHDGSDEVVGLLGSAARFFYCAKASKRDRDEGCDGLPQTIKQSVAHGDKRHGTLPYTNEPREMKPRPRGNHHPTVKPTALMRYLCRLVTPPGGTVLDPFMGSGSTGKAAMLEGFRFIGIEREAEYVEIAKARIESAHGRR